MVVEGLIISALSEIGKDVITDQAVKRGGPLAIKLWAGVQGLAYHARVFSLGLPEIKLGETQKGHAQQLKRLTERGRADTLLPHRVIAEGNFMPGSLLCFGWWERQNRKLLKGDQIEWGAHGPIKNWLFSGFEQWAPSWDINHWNSPSVPDVDAPFIGQIGTGDEADSIPVVILDGDKARIVREELQGIQEQRGLIARDALVSGVLCSAKYFSNVIGERRAKIVADLLKKEGMPGFSILIRKDEKEDFVEIHGERKVDIYSGYMWRCLCPDTAMEKGPPKISDLFFVWEHTNLADNDCIRYNLDSLDRKEAYLTELLKRDGLVSTKMRKMQELTPEHRLRSQGSPCSPPELSSSEFLQIYVESRVYTEG
jgi:hypothetical protein